MRKSISIVLFSLGVLIVGYALISGQSNHAFNHQGFAALPVLDGGRIKPLDTVARVTLLALRGKQNASYFDDTGKAQTASPSEWLVDVALDRNRAANRYHIFRVDDPDVLGLLHSQEEDVRYFSYSELVPHLDEIERQHALIPEEKELRSRYQQAIARLRNGLGIYQNITNSFYPPDVQNGPAEEYAAFETILPDGMQALLNHQNRRDLDDPTLESFLIFAQRYRELAESSRLLIIPMPVATSSDNTWENIGTALLSGVREHTVDPVVMGYAKLASARQVDDAETFDSALEELRNNITSRTPSSRTRITFELFFNGFQPFYTSMALYVLIFLVAAFSWIINPRPLADAAYWLLLLTFLVHTFGLAARIYLSGYAPVTNLYSSAVFVGWGAVAITILLEHFHRIGIGSAVASVVGFCSLLVAHHLSMDGDTLEMMQAVLDSNFWLSTHVITITIGYSSTFLAGFLGLLYVIRGVLTPGFSREHALALNRMVYAVLCFALLFSFVGTVLGGIWADQSWGRFWGWDPKENGALMIVLWIALALHARRGAIVDERGLMLLAVAGNIVASWSWFGTNMLGIGLHSYGFTDKAFIWLMAFWGSQIVVICIGSLNPRFWASKHIFRQHRSNAIST